MVLKSVKWASIPVLLIAAMFSSSAGSYATLADFAICLGAIFLVQWAVGRKEYFWAAGFVGIAVMFSPQMLVVKVFLLMGLTCLATCVGALLVFRSASLVRCAGRRLRLAQVAA